MPRSKYILSQPLVFDSYLAEYVSLSAYASVAFIPNGVKRANRSNSTIVGNPRSLHARRDGKFTIRGRNRHESRTVALRGGVLRTTTLQGVVQDYTV